MARSIDTILAGYLASVSTGFWTLEPVFAGLAAQVHLLELTGELLVAGGLVGGADDIWLTLLAHGDGIDRATGETDADLRLRMRQPEKQVTPTAIEDRVNDLLASGTCQVIEHFAAWGQVIDVDFTCDVSAIYDRRPGFTVIVPDGLDNYPTLYAEVLRIKAAGVPAWLVIED